MKPVMALVTFAISYQTESWNTVGKGPLFDTNLKIATFILFAAGGLAFAMMKVQSNFQSQNKVEIVKGKNALYKDNHVVDGKKIT